MLRVIRPVRAHCHLPLWFEPALARDSRRFIPKARGWEDDGGGGWHRESAMTEVVRGGTRVDQGI